MVEFSFLRKACVGTHAILHCTTNAHIVIGHCYTERGDCCQSATKMVYNINKDLVLAIICRYMFICGVPIKECKQFFIVVCLIATFFTYTWKYCIERFTI